MDEALRARNRAFSILGGAGLLLLILVTQLGDSVGGDDDPGVLTFGALAFFVADLAFLDWYFFSPSKVLAMRDRVVAGGDDASLSETGKTLGWLAAGLAFAPFAVGVGLFFIGGSAWSVYLMAAVSLGAGFVFWRRVGRALELLASQEGSAS